MALDRRQSDTSRNEVIAQPTDEQLQRI